MPEVSLAVFPGISAQTKVLRQGGALFVCVIAKVTFELVPGGVAKPVAPVPLAEQDAWSTSKGLVRAWETFPIPTVPGVVLTGTAHVPGGVAKPSMAVRLGVSRERPLVNKTLHVFGPRSVAAPAQGTPFTSLPLAYEKAFGGPGVWENPIGVGGPASPLLPQVVDPTDPRRVAGFGPVAPNWMPRRALAGGLDASVFEQPIIEVPSGLDPRFFQAAPQDQQVSAIAGDEWIVLDGMHPTSPRVESRLPGQKPLAKITLSGRSAPVDLKTDMLVIDADRGVVSLVSRGTVPVPSGSTCAVSVGLAVPGQAVRWPPEEAVPAKAPSKSAFSTETTDVDVASILKGKMPFDPSRSAGLAPQEAPRAKPPATPMSTGTSAIDLQKIFQSATPFREETPAPLSAPLPFAPADPSKPPAESVASPKPPKPPGMSTGTTDVDLSKILGGRSPFGHKSPESQTISAQIPAPSPGDRAPEPIAQEPEPPRAEEVSAPLPPPPAEKVPVPPAAEPPKEATAPAAQTTTEKPKPHVSKDERRKRVEEKLREKRGFDGEDLSFANLSGLDFSGTSLIRCDLTGARLRGTVLRGAKLVEAKLDEADLRGAMLEGADLRDARGAKATFEQATLKEALLERAKLPEANFTRADLTGARLSGAMLEDACFAEAQANGAAFTEAKLSRASFVAASCRKALFVGANLAFAVLEQADFQGASLERANVFRASRKRMKLAGAETKGMHETDPATDQ